MSREASPTTHLQQRNSSMNWSSVAILVSAATLVVFISYQARDMARVADSNTSVVHTESSVDDAAHLSLLRDRLLTPRTLEGNRSHQFLHLHHMKTAGTSMDQLLRCSARRWKESHDPVPYSSLHECSAGHYRACVSGDDQRCHKTTRDAGLLSYCAPLSDLPVFEWEHATSAVTVLRHPVHRVWSMYRFRTKGCYDCRPLDTILQDILHNNATYLAGQCRDQLVNHQTANLLSSRTLNVTVDDPTVVVENAITNMQNFFTLIGLTEDMDTTMQMMEQVFPWTAPILPDSETNCTLQHANASPRNNRCGPNGSHMDLPDLPPPHIEELIRKVNPLDMQVYEAAERWFDLQKQVLLDE